MYDELVNELRDGDAFEICGAYDILGRAADAIENLDHIAGTYAETAHELLEKNRWIPVTERLPEFNENVLVYSAHSGLMCIDANIQFDRNATHWMPLPEPPEKNET